MIKITFIVDSTYNGKKNIYRVAYSKDICCRERIYSCRTYFPCNTAVNLLFKLYKTSFQNHGAIPFYFSIVYI